MSRNHSVEVWCKSQCPFSEHGLRGQESRQQSVDSELPRSKYSQIAAHDLSSNCAIHPNEIDNSLAPSIPSSNSLTKTDDSHRGPGVFCMSSRKGCSSNCSSDTFCSSKTSYIKSPRVKKRHILQQTEPEQSWQTRCSNFIINMPMTLSDKLFGARRNCEALKESKHTICDDDLRINKSQPVPENTSKPSSRDQGNKKSVASWVSSLADCGCHKNIGTEKVFLEKANQVDPCYARASQSIQRSIPCERSVRKTEKGTTSCKKVTSKCAKSCEDSFARLKISANYSDRFQSRKAKPHEPRFECGTRNQTCSSISEEKKRRKTSFRFSNWPAIISKKFCGSRNEKLLRCCDVDNEVKLRKTTDRVVHSPEINFKVGSLSAAKKGRLLLKKYTISQTPEALEETLCYDILADEQLYETRTELRNQVCAKMTSDDQQERETIQERNQMLGKRLEMGRSYTSKRCIKSKRNVSKSCSRKTKQLEKKTSTEHIFLSSLITKLLNRQMNVKDGSNGSKCNQNSTPGQNRNKEDRRERKYIKHRTDIISRKYAATSIHRHKNKSIAYPRYIGKTLRKDEPASCSLEQNVLLDCAVVDFPNVSNKDQSQRKISSDFSSGRKDISEQKNTRTYLSEDNLQDIRDSCKKVTQIMTHCPTDRLKDESSNEEECQGCDSCGSAKVKGRVKLGVLQVVDKSCRQDSRELRCIEMHRKNREAKSDVREKCCKNLLSPKTFVYRVRKRDGIKYNDLQLAFRKRHVGGLMSQQRETREKGICAQRHRDKSVPKNGFENYDALKESESLKLENYRNIDLIFNRRERRSKKRCHREQLPTERFCETLMIEENEISDPRKDQGSQFLMDGTRRTSVIAGENICVKMFHDRETRTDDLPGSLHCQNSECPKEQQPNRKLLCTRSIPGKNMKNIENCSLSSQETEQNSVTNGIRSSESVKLERNSVEFYPEPRSPEKVPFLNEHSKRTMQKQPENAMRIRVGYEECVETSCKNNTRWVRPGGISTGVDILEDEQDVGKVFLSRQKARGEHENTVCETCLYKALIKLETKEAPGISKEDEFYQKQSTGVQSSLKVNNCSPSFVSLIVCTSRSDSTNESSDKNEDTNDNRQLLKASPVRSEQVDGVHPKMNISEKQSSWIKSPGKDLDVTKPESRNIINSYYSRRKSVVASRHEARNNEHTKVKKGKVQRDGSASEKNSTKARKPFQRIENVRQVGCSANSVIKDNKSKKRDAVEKENGIINKKSQYAKNGDVFHNDAKDCLVQNNIIDNSNLPTESISMPTDNHILLIQNLKAADSVNLETHTPVSKIAKKSRPLTKNKTSERVLTSTIKAPESSSVKLEESSRKSWLKQRNSRTASSKTDAKVTAKEAGKIAASAESESSNRLTRSIDTCDTKVNERHKELKTPAYICDKDNVKAETLQIKTSSVEEQNIPNGAVGKATNWIAKKNESSKSSKSSNSQRYDEQREDGRSCNSTAAKEPKENKQMKGNQSKSETASKKNEKDKKSTPLKLLSQIDSQIDANSSTQESVTMNADLFADALMDGKNNIKSYRDLQSATEENSDSNRISASKDEGLRKSGTATDQSKSKVLKSSKGSKTGAKQTPGKSTNDKELRNFKANASKITETGREGRFENMSKTSSANVHIKNTNKRLTADSELDKYDVTANSLRVEVSNTEACGSTTCRNNDNRGRNVELRSSARNSKNHLEKQHLLTERNLKKNSITLADCNYKKSCTSRTMENAVLPKNISNEKYSVCTSNKKPSHEGLSYKFRMLPCHTKNEMHTSSSRPSSDSEYNDTESNELCKHFQHSSTNGKKQIAQHNNVPDKLTTSCTSERIISDPSEQNFCFTDDLKRLLDQGQEFFTLKIRRNSNQTTSCCDSQQESPSGACCKSNDSEVPCRTTEFCKSIDYEKLQKSLKNYDADQASSNSISSLQKAYGTLKTILNKTRNIQKGFTNAKQMKETQISIPILGESSNLVEDCITSHENAKSPELNISKENESPTASIPSGNSIFSHPNSPTCTESNKKL